MALETVAGVIVFAAVLFVPGYFLTLAFFPSRKEIDLAERLTFSVVFSIGFLPLVILIENQLLGMPIEFFSVFSSLLLIVVIALLIYLTRTQRLDFPVLNRIFPKVEAEDVFELIPKFK